jgi:DNA-binding NarL/FixJ family response regulator
MCPQTAVLVLSQRPEVRESALAAGADGFFCETDPPAKLLRAISAWAGGDAAIGGDHGSLVHDDA